MPDAVCCMLQAQSELISKATAFAESLCLAKYKTKINSTCYINKETSFDDRQLSVVWQAFSLFGSDL